MGSGKTVGNWLIAEDTVRMQSSHISYSSTKTGWSTKKKTSSCMHSFEMQCKNNNAKNRPKCACHQRSMHGCNRLCCNYWNCRLIFVCLHLQMRGAKDEYGGVELLGPCLAIHPMAQNGSPMSTDSISPRPDMYPGERTENNCSKISFFLKDQITKRYMHCMVTFI